MKILEHLKDEELAYKYSEQYNEYFYTLMKENKSSLGYATISALLKKYETDSPTYYAFSTGNILLKAPLKDFLTLYPEHFL